MNKDANEFVSSSIAGQAFVPEAEEYEEYDANFKGLNLEELWDEDDISDLVNGD